MLCEACAQLNLKTVVQDTIAGVPDVYDMFPASVVRKDSQTFEGYFRRFDALNCSLCALISRAYVDAVAVNAKSDIKLTRSTVMVPKLMHVQSASAYTCMPTGARMK